MQHPKNNSEIEGNYFSAHGPGHLDLPPAAGPKHPERDLLLRQGTSVPKSPPVTVPAELDNKLLA